MDNKSTPEALRKEFGENDAIRDTGLTTPENIVRMDNISYGTHGKWNLLDIYYPRGTCRALPAIISVHGGAWVYGTKDLYQYYCMSLAQHGFTVVNFSYRLAPEDPFPAAVEDINAVFTWVAEEGTKYFIDSDNLFVVGDSAGAQLASQYMALLTSREFRDLYDFKIPYNKIRIKAAALNCGIYDVLQYVHDVHEAPTEVIKAYMGEDTENVLKKLDTVRYINESFPPSFIMTSYCDFLRDKAEPMYRLLQEKGVECEYHIYGAEDREDIAHVFHCNMRLPEAAICNDEECEFFKRHVQY